MSAEPAVCGRYMPVPEYYDGTEMFRCSVCDQTLPEKEDFLGDGCQRLQGDSS